MDERRADDGGGSERRPKRDIWRHPGVFVAAIAAWLALGIALTRPGVGEAAFQAGYVFAIMLATLVLALVVWVVIWAFRREHGTAFFSPAIFGIAAVLAVAASPIDLLPSPEAHEEAEKQVLGAQHEQKSGGKQAKPAATTNAEQEPAEAKPSQEVVVCVAAAIEEYDAMPASERELPRDDFKLLMHRFCALAEERGYFEKEPTDAQVEALMEEAYTQLVDEGKLEE
ncbi:MAG TPA: hypothetical protein VM290_10645 [Gaiellaceae bacterium]|jgi:hypothetical protein|nr:hypothetical protein [Gaiellaceae bacterium]